MAVGSKLKRVGLRADFSFGAGVARLNVVLGTHEGLSGLRGYIP